jgi:dihydroorotase
MEKSSVNSYSIEEFNKIESLIKILEGIREFANQQLKEGENSIFIKLRPAGNHSKSDAEYISEIMKAFKSFCLPSFLMKGDIYEKMFHEKLTSAKKNQVITIAKNLWTIHQTFSTKGIAKLQDIDLQLLRSKQMSQKEVTNIFKSQEKRRTAKALAVSSELKVEEFKNLKLTSDELAHCK